jgi:hypothetical protein
MFIEDRGLVFDATCEPSTRRIAFFSSLCVLRSGTILCGFEVGSAKHALNSTLGLCRSRDGGVRWEPLPVEFATTQGGVSGSLAGGEIVEAAPGRLRMIATWFDRSEPGRPLFDPATEGILHSKMLLATSDDEGQSWSAWEELRVKELAGCATTGPIIAWPDGTLAYAFESFKEFDDPRPARHAAWIVVSRDAGRSLAAPLLVAQDPQGSVYYWDQRLSPTGNIGEFVAMFWTHDRDAKRDLAVHMCRAAITGDGLQVGPIQATSIRGQIAAPLVLDDGRWLAFVVDRARPGTMKLWLSRDAGQSWPNADCLVIHQHEERAAVSPGGQSIDFAQYWEDMGKWSFGHPAIRRLDRQRVLVAFYAGMPDAMSIHWARVNVGNG